MESAAFLVVVSLHSQSPVSSAAELVWDRRPTHWIIFCMNCQEWNPDGKYRINGGRITIVGSFGWITPCRALNIPRNFSEAKRNGGEGPTDQIREGTSPSEQGQRRFLDSWRLGPSGWNKFVNATMRVQLGHLRLEQSLHARSHEFGINIPIEPGPLQCQAASLEIPRVGQDDSRFEGTITTFLTNILKESAWNLIHKT